MKSSSLSWCFWNFGWLQMSPAVPVKVHKARSTSLGWVGDSLWGRLRQNSTEVLNSDLVIRSSFHLPLQILLPLWRKKKPLEAMSGNRSLLVVLCCLLHQTHVIFLLACPCCHGNVHAEYVWRHMSACSSSNLVCGAWWCNRIAKKTFNTGKCMGYSVCVEQEWQYCATCGVVLMRRNSYVLEICYPSLLPATTIPDTLRRYSPTSISFLPFKRTFLVCQHWNTFITAATLSGSP